MCFLIREFFLSFGIAIIILSIILVHLAFARISIYLNSKFKNKDTLFRIKTFFEYLILIIIGYFIFF